MIDPLYFHLRQAGAALGETRSHPPADCGIREEENLAPSGAVVNVSTGKLGELVVAHRRCNVCPRTLCVRPPKALVVGD
jgi:hypothetical protein